MRVYHGGYQHGRHKACCERCGHDFRSHQMRQEWTGLMVCHGPGTNDCWEPRHPQDFVRGKRDDQSPPWTAPEPPAVFLPEPIEDAQGHVIYDGSGASIYEAGADIPSEDDL